MTPEQARQLREMLIRLEALPPEQRAYVIKFLKERLSGQKITLH